MEKTLLVKFVGGEDHISGLQQIPFNYNEIGERGEYTAYEFTFNDEDEARFIAADIKEIERLIEGMSDVESFRWQSP